MPIIPDTKNQNNIFQDASVWTLVLSNVIVIILAVVQGWSLLNLMWVYVIQSLIIGFFNFFKILNLKNFSTKNFRINNKKAEPTPETKKFTAVFFAIHYGLFHFGYIMFLSAGLPLFNAGQHEPIRVGYLLFVSLLFFINHLFSFYYNKKKDSNKTPNIGTVMFFPYARILPMHLTIVLGGIFISMENYSKIILAFFLILKTLADLIMHNVEHQI